MQHILTTRSSIGAKNIDRFRTRSALKSRGNPLGQGQTMRGQFVGRIKQPSPRRQLSGKKTRLSSTISASGLVGLPNAGCAPGRKLRFQQILAKPPGVATLPQPRLGSAVAAASASHSINAVMNATAVSGNVSAVLPLSMLEAVRAHDRPGEILEDEQFSVSLPRRLGLTGVVETQIQRYETARRAGRPVPLDEFASLLRLVLKRPDAEAILRDTGQRMAQEHFRRVSNGYLRILRVLPKGVLARAFRRSAQKLLKQMAGDATVEVIGRPPAARIRPNSLAAQDPPGVACALYAATLEHLSELFTGTPATGTHTRCAVNGSPFCEWTMTGW